MQKLLLFFFSNSYTTTNSPLSEYTASYTHLVYTRTRQHHTKKRGLKKCTVYKRNCLEININKAFTKMFVFLSTVFRCFLTVVMLNFKKISHFLQDCARVLQKFAAVPASSARIRRQMSCVKHLFLDLYSRSFQ